MLVQMNLDEDGVDIIPRDKPDTAVRFQSRAPIYVEETGVEQPGMPFGRHLEEINLAFEDLSAENAALKSMLADCLLMIKVTAPGSGDRRARRTLAAEAVVCTAEIAGEVSCLRSTTNECRQPGMISLADRCG